MRGGCRRRRGLARITWTEFCTAHHRHLAHIHFFARAQVCQKNSRRCRRHLVVVVSRETYVRRFHVKPGRGRRTVSRETSPWEVSTKSRESVPISKSVMKQGNSNIDIETYCTAISFMYAAHSLPRIDLDRHSDESEDGYPDVLPQHLLARSDPRKGRPGSRSTPPRIEEPLRLPRGRGGVLFHVKPLSASGVAEAWRSARLSPQA